MESGEGAMIAIGQAGAAHNQKGPLLHPKERSSQEKVIEFFLRMVSFGKI